MTTSPHVSTKKEESYLKDMNYTHNNQVTVASPKEVNYNSSSLALATADDMIANQDDNSEISHSLLNNKLFIAAGAGSYDEVVELINLGATIDSTNISNATALYVAARRGYDQIVELLIKNGASVDLPISSGDTALYASASEGHTKITKLLLDAGADKNIVINGHAPLLIAAHFERVDDVKLLLEYNASTLSDHIYSAFNVAQFKGTRTEKGDIIYQNIVNHYLKSLKPAPTQFEVIIARYNEDLDWAIKEFPNDKVTVYNKGLDDLRLPHNFKVILLENTGRESHTYFYHIIQNYNNLAERSLFLQGHPYEHPLFLPLARYKQKLNSTCTNIIAKCSVAYPTLLEKSNDLSMQLERKFKGFQVSYDLIEFTHRFIDKECHLNATIYTINGAQFAVDKQNILSHSIEYYQRLKTTLINNINPVEGFYLERLWDIVFAPPLKYTNELNQLLFQATLNGNEQEVKELLKIGVDINSRLADGNTILHAAASKGHSTIVSLLLKQGIDIDITNNEGAPALYFAAGFNHIETTSLLIAMKANVNLVMNNGNTPLYASAYNCYSSITQILLYSKANTEIFVKGHTPLFAAIGRGCVEDVSQLIKHGAQIIWDQDKDPLFYASFLRDSAANQTIIYQKIMNHYVKWLKTSLPDITNGLTKPVEKFTIVVVRYNEDLSWIVNEFPNEEIIIYNKGADDLDESSNNYQVIKIPNVGWFGGTILHHIVSNYDQIEGRTLFLQGHPYDQNIFFPFIRYKGELHSKCQHIIAKCSQTTLQIESDNVSQQTFKGTKYDSFERLDYNMIDFAHRFINPNYSPALPLTMVWGAEFAVDAEKIHNHKKEYYQRILAQFRTQFPMEDFYLEKLWDVVFAPPLQELKDLDSFLFQAASRGDTQEVSELLNMGASINSKHELGTTALTIASYNGHNKTVELLIEHGSEINSTGDNGMTALYAAAAHGHLSVMRLLLDAHANTELTVDSGTIVDNHTPLYIAMHSQNLEAIKLLLEYGANILSDDINSLLYIAAINADINRDKTAATIQKEKAIYEIMINHYWSWLEHHPANITEIISFSTSSLAKAPEIGDFVSDITSEIPNLAATQPAGADDLGVSASIKNDINKEFEVVIVHYQEDLLWLTKEFPHERVTIYNKGNDTINSNYLLANYQVVNIPNLGWFGGTILHHIVNNYDQLANRTLFLQGDPYPVELFLPLTRYKDDLPTKCKNIIAKCIETTLQYEIDIFARQSRVENWSATKYHHFEHIDYNMLDFAHRYIDPNYSPNTPLAMVWGAEFAVDASHIYRHSKEYYQKMLAQFQIQYPMEDFYLEKLWDIVFAPPSSAHNEHLLQSIFNDNIQEVSELLAIGAEDNYQYKE